MLSRNTEYEIFTDEGWVDFNGILKKEPTELFKISVGGTSVTATKDHKFLKNNKKVKVSDLSVGDRIETINGDELISSIEFDRVDYVYDIIEVHNESHTFIIKNSIKSSNCDEFAFVPYHVQKKFWESVYPTLTEGEGCIISSTPNGDSDLFAEMWRKADLEGENDGVETEDEIDTDIKFHAKWIKWDMPPKRDEAFKKEKIHILGMRSWRQEYECEFLGGEGTLLDNEKLLARENEIKESGQNVLFRIKDIPFFASIKAGGKYLIGVDPASGTGKDYTVIQIFEFPSLEQVAQYRTNNSRPAEVYGKFRKLVKFFTNADCQIYFSIERNGVGEGMISLWENDTDFPERAEMFHDEGKNAYGFYTTDAIKLALATKLKMLHETNSLKLHSITLIKELKNYVRKGRSYEGRPGMTDDCVSALLIIIRVLHELSESSDEAHQVLYPLSISSDGEWGEEDIHVMDEGDDDFMPFIV